jgi:hypothetical protein
MKPQDVRIRLGEYDFQRVDDSVSSDFRVLNIKVHPQYSDSASENDISILTMQRPVAFDDYVWPICLPNTDGDFVNKSATVTGEKFT